MSEGTKKRANNNQQTQSKIRNKGRFKTTQSQQQYNFEPSQQYSLKKQSRRYSEAQETFSEKKTTEIIRRNVKQNGISSDYHLDKSFEKQQTYLEELQKQKNQRIKSIYNPKGKSINFIRQKGMIQKKKQMQPEEIKYPQENELTNKPYLFEKAESKRTEELKTILQETKKRTQTQKLRYKTQKQEQYLTDTKISENRKPVQLPRFTSFYDTYSTSLQKKEMMREKCKSQNKIETIPKSYDPHLDIIKKCNLDEFIIKKYIQGVYYGQFNSQKNLKDGKGVIFYKNGKLYEGQFQNDLKNGLGYELNPDGSYYQGEFQHGVKKGKGKFIWANGEVYDGQWENNLKHGSGVWQGQGSSYIGQWKNGIISGFGVLTNSKGQRYEGEFQNFCKQGKGTFRFENGEIYVGDFYKNNPSGEGQYYWENGDYYKGSFMNGLRHGKGLMKYKNGTQYMGEFRNDKKCGLGEETFQDGVTYIGNYENNLRHGYGKIICDEVIYYDGYWLNNAAIDVIDSEEIILEDERDLITSALEQQKSQKSLINKINLNQIKKEKVKKVIRNQVKAKKNTVQKSASSNVLERLYNPNGKKLCKCMRKH